MKTARKALLIALCAVLLVAASVMGTLAYLTSTTEVVTNTMSIGNVKITLDESPVDLYGTVVDGDRVMKNDYKLIPGHKYVKDPAVHVAAGSEVCYLFVKVADGIADIQDATTVADQMLANGWVAMDNGVYYYNKTVDAREAEKAVDVPVFGTFTIKGDAAVADYAGKTITVQAYAIQADGFDSAAEAWAAAPASWN